MPRNIKEIRAACGGFTSRIHFSADINLMTAIRKKIISLATALCGLQAGACASESVLPQIQTFLVDDSDASNKNDGRIYGSEKYHLMPKFLADSKSLLLEVINKSDRSVEITVINEAPLAFFEIHKASVHNCQDKACGDPNDLVCSVRDQMLPACQLSVGPGRNIFRIRGHSPGIPVRLVPSVSSIYSPLKGNRLGEELLVFCLSALVSVLIYQMGLLIVESRAFILAHICTGWSYLGLLAGPSGLMLELSAGAHHLLSRSWSLFACLAIIFTFLEVDFYLKDFFPETKKKFLFKNSLYLLLVGASIGAMLNPQLFSGVYVGFMMGGVLVIVTKIGRFFYGRKSLKKLDFIKIFAVVLPPLVLCVVFTYVLVLYIQPIFLGLSSFLATIFFVFLYSLLMSIVFGVLASEWRMKLIRTEESLELGRNVQDLLIENSGRTIQEGWDLVVYYEPYLGRMSGDWIMRWETPDGTQHLLFGDVTGKGPQAALTVAMVASVVNSQARNLSSSSKCVEELNKALFHACNGQVSTTVSGASYDKSGHVSLLNCGGPGWLVVKNDQCEHWMGRGGILGLSPILSVNPKGMVLAPGDLIVGVTDGVASSLRDMKHVAQIVKSLINAQTSGHHISSHILARPSVKLIADDKAMICLQKTAS